MRPALSVLRNAIESSGRCQSCWSCTAVPSKATRRAQSSGTRISRTQDDEVKANAQPNSQIINSLKSNARASTEQHLSTEVHRPQDDELLKEVLSSEERYLTSRRQRKSDLRSFGSLENATETKSVTPQSAQRSKPRRKLKDAGARVVAIELLPEGQPALEHHASHTPPTVAGNRQLWRRFEYTPHPLSEGKDRKIGAAFSESTLADQNTSARDKDGPRIRFYTGQDGFGSLDASEHGKAGNTRGTDHTATSTTQKSPAQPNIVSRERPLPTRFNARGLDWANSSPLDKDLRARFDTGAMVWGNVVACEKASDAVLDNETMAWEPELAHGEFRADAIRMSWEEGPPIKPSPLSLAHSSRAYRPTAVATSKQHDYDSIVHRVKKSRFVSEDDDNSDIQRLRQAVLHQRRHAGTGGLKLLWKEIQDSNIELPTEGAGADQLWGNFVQMGIDHDLLASVIQYAIELQRKTGSSWRDFYYDIISSKITHNSPTTSKYHDQLYEIFPPTVEQFMSLFDLVHKRRPLSIAKMRNLQRIYADLPFRKLYERIITRLYQNEDFSAAASWHSLLIIKKDVPTDLYLYRPLFRYMVLYGDRKLLAVMVDRMVEARIPLPSFITHPLPISPASQELIDQRLAEIHGIKPQKVDDEFCARLFATTWFSIGTVVNILRLLGVDILGAHSLREILVRDRANPDSVMASLTRVESAGIGLATSTYCSLVKRLLAKGNTHLLENVVQSDLSPDTFDNRALQESLLFDYYNRGDQLQVDRTLATLTAKFDDDSQPMVRWNVHLRLHLKRKDIKAVNHTLELMHASQITIEPISSAYVRVCLLTRRTIGKRPQHIYDLPIIISIWQNVLRSGGVVPCVAWREILRRLGMTGQLKEYEKLALWLAKYYSGSSAGDSLGLLPGHQTMSKRFARRLINIPSRLPPGEPSHPLYVLFTPAVQQAIIAWGFQHARIGSTNWRWGLQLLLKLKLFRVHVERSSVARACKIRLAHIFGTGQSNRMINRRTQAQNAHALSHYVQEMEKIGGTSLFFGSGSPKQEAERVELLQDGISRWEERSNRRARAPNGITGPEYHRLPPDSADPDDDATEVRPSKFDIE